MNLFWGIDRVVATARKAGRSVGGIREATVEEAKRMAEEDVRGQQEAGERSAAGLLEDGDVVMTQCNAGALATVGYGTALGVIRAAREAGRCVKVIVNETRPRSQGSRLTAFELVRDGFHCTLISDTAVGFMMSSGRVDKVIVGADRITRDGYVFNKIGTYQVAVLAKQARGPVLRRGAQVDLRPEADPRPDSDRGEGLRRGRQGQGEEDCPEGRSGGEPGVRQDASRARHWHRH